jgi:hypothetical protein
MYPSGSTRIEKTRIESITRFGGLGAIFWPFNG